MGFRFCSLNLSGLLLRIGVRCLMILVPKLSRLTRHRDRLSGADTTTPYVKRRGHSTIQAKQKSTIF